MDREKFIQRKHDEEIQKDERDRIMSILRKIDCDKYLVTDFYEDNKVNAFWNLDKFIVDVSKEIYK